LSYGVVWSGKQDFMTMLQNSSTAVSKHNNANEHCVPASVLWINRLALFIIFFWFGLLKLLHLSPAESMIRNLHKKTIAPIISIDHFLIVLGFIECIIGILWLVPGLTRITLVIFLTQMVLTFLPLAIMPGETWDHFFVLSLSGQYILKNVVLVASAFTIYKDCQVKGWKRNCF
jgi:uncharacterized membrane protein YkgB